MTTIGDIHKFKMESLKKPKPKRWTSPIPKNCDFCHKSLKDEKVFVDGRTRSGPWAIMCSVCYDTVGVGIGTGKGQAYELPSGKKIVG